MIHIKQYLTLPCPPSALSPLELHPSRLFHLYLADQDSHEPQESPGYQGDQCTDWGGSCCPPTEWKNGLVG